MRQDASVEKAERASSLRASLMAAGAAIVAIHAWAEWGGSDSPGPAGGALWVLLVIGWTLVLATGGGLALGKRMRALLNDELSLRNRARATAAGFYAMLAAAVCLHVAGLFAQVASGDSVRLIAAAGLSTALFVYSWLERN